MPTLPSRRALSARRPTSILLVTSLASLLVSCGGGGDSPTPPAQQTVSSVTVGALSTITVGGTAQATATARDAAGAAITGRTVTWTSGNNTIATVNASGLVTGVGAGSADITATVDGRSGSATITVQAPVATVATVTVGAVPATLLVGATAQAAVTAREANGAEVTGRTATWASSNASVATVSLTGLVTAVAPGTTEITAVVSGVTGRATLVVQPVVSTVTVGALAALLPGATAQAAATARDAAGTAITGRPVTWSSSSVAVATVSTTGLVTGVAPGTATITASVDGRTGSIAIEVVNPAVIPFFDSKPFAGEFPVTNFMDHDIPKEFVDNNGRFTTFWGEVLENTGGMVDGHSGYDWMMPVGTPLLAVADGRVVRVDESSQSFFCPPLNRNVNDQKSIYIEHDLPGGVKVRSWYVHNSENRVAVGQTVTAGQTVALSGNTGCSSAPHLHFEVFRVTSTAPLTLRTIDPYGWSGAFADPWAQHVDGAPSINLWKPGKAPVAARETVNNFTASPASAAAVIAKIVMMGPNDNTNPNNEYIEIGLDSRVAATASLDGYRIRADKALVNFAIPAGITLNATRPTVRFYSGTGTNTATEIYMGRTAPVWSNHRDDCARLVSPAGGQYRWNLGNGCPLPGPTFP